MQIPGKFHQANWGQDDCRNKGRVATKVFHDTVFKEETCEVHFCVLPHLGEDELSMTPRTVTNHTSWSRVKHK